MYNIMKVKLFALVLLVLTFASMSCGRTEREDEAEKYLLPEGLKPVHYNIYLRTKLDEIVRGKASDFTFDGQLQIFMRTIRSNVSKIVLNSVDSTVIHESIFYREGFQPIKLKNAHFDYSSQKLTFDLPTSLQMNENLRLHLKYTSSYTSANEGLFGFVYGYYHTNTTKKWILNTELEPVYARLVFPCFDEPKYKATYNVSVAIPNSLVSEGYHALSNAPESRRERINEDTVIHFEQTKKPMSTYLFSVVVSDITPTKPRYFNASYPKVKLGELKTWGSSNTEVRSREFFQSVAAALMNIYSKDFNFGYGFSKLDQALLDTYVGAMENWGLVLYGYGLGHDWPDFTAKIIAHELAHQWFGNTVTLHWWSDLWLNEGFATYFEYHGADKINENGIDGKLWDLPSQFVTNIVQYKGMFFDVPEEENHPLTVEVYNPDECYDYFDSLEYGKGGAIVRMWSHITGEEAFQSVLHDYLEKFQYRVATPEGLLEIFDVHANKMESDLAGMKPSKMFRNWHLKAGVPIVSVKKSTQNPRIYVLSQDVFRLSNATKAEEAEWFIPISYSTSDHYNFNNTVARFWLKPKENINLTLSKPVKWIVCNNQETGYYRVNYNIENWESLFHVLNTTTEDIHEINRAQIVDDSMEIARSTAFDYLPYATVLDMLFYLRKETSHLPWTSAFNKLQFLKNLMSKDEAHYKLFQAYVLDLLTNRTEDDWIKQKVCGPNKIYELEKKLVSLACEMGHSSCTAEASSIILNSLKSGSNVCDDVLELAYCVHVRSNDEDGSFWEFLWDRYTYSENLKYKKLLLNGMACTKKEVLLKRIFERAIDLESDITRTERREMFSAMLRGNAENAKMLLDLVSENLEKVLKAFHKNLLQWSFLADMARSLGTYEELSQVQGIAKKMQETENVSPRGLRNLKRAISIVKTNQEWLEMRSKSVIDWLKSKY